ncbi:MAG: CoA-binding protein [Acidobacteria bacterium]|nr:CoA-binding protein [Acidobacteriota bacterium]
MSKTCAIVGASNDRRKFGNKSLRAHAKAGYTVYPINLNPKESEIEGHRAYHSLAEIPGKIDRITLYLPPPVLLEMIDEIAAANADEVWFNPGTDSPEVMRQAKAAGIPAIAACSIVDLGMSPADFPS